MSLSEKMAGALQTVVRALETRRGRRLFCAAVAVGFVLFGIPTVYRAEIPKRTFVPRLHYTSPMVIGDKVKDKQARYHSSEFRGFRKLSWGTAVEGLDPYNPAEFHVRAYPPFFGIAFFPFAVVWQMPGVGSGLFYVVSFGFAIISAWCCSRLLRRNGDTGRFGLFALIFLLLIPLALAVMVRCETDMLVLCPVCVAFLWLAQGRKPFRAGALLGFAVALKVLPGLFAVYLLCRRQWRALMGMAAAGVFCTVLLPVIVWGPQRAWELHLSWYRNVVAPYHSAGAGAVIGKADRPSNQSLSAALSRYLQPVGVKTHRGAEPQTINVASLEPHQVRSVVKVLHVCIALGAIFLWVRCGRKREDPLSRAVVFATVGPAILLLSEISLTTHHVLLLPAVAAVVIRMMRPDDERARWWGWVIPVYLLALVGNAIPAVKMLTPLLPATVALLAACAALAIGDGRGEEVRLKDE